VLCAAGRAVRDHHCPGSGIRLEGNGVPAQRTCPAAASGGSVNRYQDGGLILIRGQRDEDMPAGSGHGRYPATGAERSGDRGVIHVQYVIAGVVLHHGEEVTAEIAYDNDYPPLDPVARRLPGNNLFIAKNEREQDEVSGPGCSEPMTVAADRKPCRSLAGQVDTLDAAKLDGRVRHDPVPRSRLLGHDRFPLLGGIVRARGRWRSKGTAEARIRRFSGALESLPTAADGACHPRRG
jgi:hypothetical protein